MVMQLSVVFGRSLFSWPRCALPRSLLRHHKFSQVNGGIHLYESHRQNSYSDPTSFIRENTRVTQSHLTPELQLHLITPECPLWHSRGEECPVPDPFWAFYWPGGQALTRYLLDSPSVVHDKVVLDVGSGCGATAIASAKAGARVVIANDICPVAATAIKMNSRLNKVNVAISQQDLIGVVENHWDIILLGDMFYDADFANTVFDWIKKLKMHGKHILIGDPGRFYISNHPMRTALRKLREYELLSDTKQENHGLTHGYVWTVTNDIIYATV